MRFGAREIMLVGLLVALPVAAWWFIFRPQNRRDAALRVEITARQDKLRALNRATATIGNLQKEIVSLQEAIAFFQSKLPGEKEIDRVLRETWRMAERNRLITKSIRTLDRNRPGGFTAASGPHAEQSIMIQLEGDFLGFYAFLQALEAQPRIMRILDMAITKPPKGAEGRIEATLIVAIFFERTKDAPS